MLFPALSPAPTPAPQTPADPCVGCRSAELAEDGRVYCRALIAGDSDRAQSAAAWIMAGLTGVCGARQGRS